MAKHERFCGEDAVVLENKWLRLVALPGRGGKTASLVYRPTGFEVLSQPKGDYPPLTPGMSFSDGDASGFDDVFPSMGVEEYAASGQTLTLPDHGELWTKAMSCREEGGGILLETCTDLFPARYEKRITLEDNAARWDIRITNTGDAPMPCLWVCHCLMRWEEGVRFAFPQDAETAENLIPGTALGAGGALVSMQGGSYDFTTPPTAGHALKFYVSQPVKNGICRAIYPQSGVTAALRWSTDTLPYLGFWITTGAYRGDKNFAFEPATGYYDTAACAAKHNALPMLTPGETLQLSLEIELGEDGR